MWPKMKTCFETEHHECYHVASTYNRYASFYDLLFGKVLHHGRKKFGAVFQGEPGQTVLEIGVGTGLMLPFYPRHLQVLGIDLSANMLGQAQAAVDRHHLDNVTLKLLDAELSGLPASSFDYVVLPYVYSVTRDPHLLMRQAFHLCKPGGYVWILNHFSQSRLWACLERPLNPFAKSIGFRTNFAYSTYVAKQNWDIVAEYKVNLFSVSRLIKVRNSAEGRNDGGYDNPNHSAEPEQLPVVRDGEGAGKEGLFGGCESAAATLHSREDEDRHPARPAPAQ